MRFRGREMAHKELGLVMLNRVEEDLSDPNDPDTDLGDFSIKIKTQDVDNSTDTDLVLVRVEVESHFHPTFQLPGLPTMLHVEHHVHFRQFR